MQKYFVENRKLNRIREALVRNQKHEFWNSFSEAPKSADYVDVQHKVLGKLNPLVENLTLNL